MSERRLFLDEAPGERRGVVTLDGQPERLLIERHDDVAVQQTGARVMARVRRIERALNSAFLDLGEGPDALISLHAAATAITEGAWLDVEITAPPRREKGAVACLMGTGQGPACLLTAAPNLTARLQAFSPGSAVITGVAAQEAADTAEDVALQIEHPLPSGGRIFIEPTQALVAVDVDLSAAGGDARKAVVRANREALAAAARLLRLKGLGGLVAIDLAGKGHDGAAFAVLAKAAFAPDGASVSFGPISRFGIFELSLPRTVTPLAERLLGPDGRPSAATTTFRLLRAIERAAGPGIKVQASCAPIVAQIAAGLSSELVDRIGARFVIEADAGRAPMDFEVRVR